uniref:Uncharacterized protein n=1 Tax=Vespula pensylvanica TaxID=30213 RepID=A0A834U8G4_VESPE|nr:hypothetical protein H0235_009443 [Vespula pensylvanica]
MEKEEKIKDIFETQDNNLKPIVNGTGANERVGKMFPLNLGDEPLLGGSTPIRPSEADSSGGFHSSSRFSFRIAGTDSPAN